ncbi:MULTISPECIES: hypothetical protein [unclassified Rhizobium]|jgi:hypothetical protein|uniref:hypothetical protein n=1 Tax=unclassified Rhizobium TaxID=2613769 RepID=UPI00064644C0|nr:MULTISPECIES: hypothetical protein [unclassified Rhizobium]OJY66543.1 MAG: hypothetical protein BGP09_32015 [Rhizobium sp. 60-20]
MFLLSTQALMDIICENPDVTGWIRPVPAQAIHASVVSVAHVQAEILATPLEEGREVMDLALRAFVSFTRRNNALELFDEAAGAVFSRIAQLDLQVDGDEDLGDMSRMVVATAIDRNLVLVEGSQPYHGKIDGLRVKDPYRCRQ